MSASQEDSTVVQTKDEDKGVSFSSPDGAYHLEAGASSLREINGERVIEMRGGVLIIHGDITVTSERGFQYTQQRLTHLLGNVNIDRDNLHMEGDEGEYRRFQDQAILRRNVTIVDEGWTIRCDEAVYFKSTEKAMLRGNVVAVDSSSTLHADSLFYDKPNLTAEVFGNVKLVSENEGVELVGKHGFYYRERGEGIIDDAPHLIIDPQSAEPATVDSDTMMFYPNEDRAIAFGRVKIIKGTTVTQCDSAVLVDSENRVELYGSPLAKKDNVTMKGGKMLLGYNDEEINRIDIIKDAVIRDTPTDTLVIDRESWIQGDSLVLHMRDNRLDSIHVVGNASSRYFPESPTRRVESNYINGDTMFFQFERDSLSYVKIDGNADGVYRYVDLEIGETTDSLRALKDTLWTFVPFVENAQRVIYTADNIQYFTRQRDLVLKNRAKIVYQNKTLIGKQIDYNSNLQLLEATGAPVLIEGPDKVYGEQMDYDLETGVGLVEGGSTRFLQGFYEGAKIAKVGDNVLKVWNSKYTTCDRKDPHYHFASNQMKVYLDDKAVTGPILLYIGDTPVGFLPFMAQNIRQGRRSGMLRPDFEFGITSSGDRFIRNIGYYWATNDYTDFTFIGDFNEQRSMRFLINNRYRLRYFFNGGVNYSFLRNLDDFRDEWLLSANHNHTLGDRFSFTSSLRFVSSDEAPSSVSRIDEVANVIDRRIESTLTLRKSWDTVGFSTFIRRVQALNITDPTATKVGWTLPSISLTIPSRSLYFGQTRRAGKKTFWEKFLGGIRYNPSTSFVRTSNERLNDKTEVIDGRASINFNSQQRVGFLNFSPTLTASDSYRRTETEVNQHLIIDNNPIPPDTTIVPSSRTVVTDNQFNWSVGARASTNLYGTFYPKIGVLTGLRHAVSPSASYTFRPSVGSRPSSQAVGLSLNNTFDLKVKDGEEEKKLAGVLIWALGSGYNPDAPDRSRWSNISSRVNLRVLGTTISLNQSIDPYEFDILSTQVTSSFVFRGTHSFGSSGEAAIQELNIMASDTTSGTIGDTIDKKTDREPTLEKAGLPWSLAASISYSKAKLGLPRSTLNLIGDINLTRNWRISYTTTYDVEQRDLLAQNYTLYRDLHCWQMSFTNQQLGDEWEFYFNIRLGAHSEIKLEQGQRGLGVGGFDSPFSY